MRAGREGRRTEGTLIVFGLVFDLPYPGIVVQFLQYLIGLRRLGWEVWYVEDSHAWPHDDGRGPVAAVARSLQAVAPVLERHGLGDRWVYRSRSVPGECFGAGDRTLGRLYREADVALNVTGAQEMRQEHSSIPRRVYVQSDPFGMQVDVATGAPRPRAQLAAHDRHFTFGELVGTPGCLVPDDGFAWQPTRQPVVLDLWRPTEQGDTYTTVTSWHNESKDRTWGGHRYYWTKGREFLSIIDLPSRVALPLELAVESTPREADDLRRLGWRLREAREVAGDVAAYQRYILRSRGELTVARDQYVRPRTGWFSDRSACYLAAGKPVVTQDTGFGQVLPTGEGLLAFTGIEEAAAALATIEGDYPRHADAARQIAEEHFAAEIVLPDLLRRALA